MDVRLVGGFLAMAVFACVIEKAVQDIQQGEAFHGGVAAILGCLFFAGYANTASSAVFRRISGHSSGK